MIAFVPGLIASGPLGNGCPATSKKPSTTWRTPNPGLNDKDSVRIADYGTLHRIANPGVRGCDPPARSRSQRRAFSSNCSLIRQKMGGEAADPPHIAAQAMRRASRPAGESREGAALFGGGLGEPPTPIRSASCKGSGRTSGGGDGSAPKRSWAPLRMPVLRASPVVSP